MEGWQSGLMRRIRNAVGRDLRTGSNPVPSANLQFQRLKSGFRQTML